MSVWCSPPSLRCLSACALLLCALILPSAPCLADQPDSAWSVRGWSSDRGLPVDEDYGLAQSVDGYIWIATLRGVFRFDGSQFIPTPVPQLSQEYSGAC